MFSSFIKLLSIFFVATTGCDRPHLVHKIKNGLPENSTHPLKKYKFKNCFIHIYLVVGSAGTLDSTCTLLL